MQLSEIIALLNCEVVCDGGSLERSVSTCFAADLMSDVLAYSCSDAILLTGLTGIQSVHAADVAELQAIIYVHHKTPGAQVLEVARSRGIPLLSTKHNLFDACGILFSKGVEGA